MTNQVTLTFAGETKNLEESFDRTGERAKRMGDDVRESGEGFRKAGEAADEVDTKAMGFRDTLTGVQDTTKGVALLMKGPSYEGFLTLGAGIGDLGSGFYNFLIPALEKTRLATLAQTAASKVAAVGSRIWAGAQALLNLSFLTSPITWIILGIVALIAVIVLIATKTNWFQRAWSATWSWVTKAARNSWDFIKKIPGWIGGAFAKVAGFIMTPYRIAFNYIARAWNSTIGQLSWSVPAWVPFIGGNTISVPHLPTFHTGGVVAGAPGTNQMIMAQAGERISAMGSNAGGGQPIMLGSDGSQLGDLLIQVIALSMKRTYGRDPAALGISLKGARLA